MPLDQSSSSGIGAGNIYLFLCVCVRVCVLVYCVFQEEDLTDEVFAKRHLALEEKEKLRWASWGKRQCCRRPKRWKHKHTVNAVNVSFGYASFTHIL